MFCSDPTSFGHESLLHFVTKHVPSNPRQSQSRRVFSLTCKSARSELGSSTQSGMQGMMHYLQLLPSRTIHIVLIGKSNQRLEGVSCNWYGIRDSQASTRKARYSTNFSSCDVSSELPSVPLWVNPVHWTTVAAVRSRG